tara:strand:+ start:253 stop:1152 length:900 start_codon:yes stop_codon:yes gene_type:complete
MKILVSGKNSQIGKELSNLILNSAHDFMFTSSKTMNLFEKKNIEQIIREYNPDIIVNLSAYTKVDLSEDNKEDAYLVNAEAPKIIAKIASEINALLIHISTDYVFGKDEEGPFRSNSKPNPINYYGFSKLEGEKAIINSKCRFIIIRTSSVFSTFGRNFVKTITKNFLSNQGVKVVKDQMISMTYAGDLANVIRSLIDRNDQSFLNKNNESMIIHYTNLGYTNWYEVADLIFRNLKQTRAFNSDLIPINLSDWPSRAKRPIDSRLSLDYDLLDSLNIKLYNWHERVSTVLDTLYESGNN